MFDHLILNHVNDRFSLKFNFNLFIVYLIISVTEFDILMFHDLSRFTVNVVFLI